MTTTTDSGPIEGYLQVAPARHASRATSATIDAEGVYYKQLNEAVRAAFADGAKTVVLENVNGQRYIGTGIKGKDLRIEVHGTPGNDMAMFMDGPTVEVFGNAQDGVGNTMNAGKVIVHGDAGDVLGYGMRGGKVFIKGDVGYRVGIHMKAYEDLRADHGVRRQGARLLRRVHGRRPARAARHELAARGPARGRLPRHRHARRRDLPARRGRAVAVRQGGRRLHGRPRRTWPSSGRCSRSTATALGMDLDEVLAEPFTKLVPVSHRPYGKLYTY